MTANGRSVVCVILIQGLLATAFPTGDNVESDPEVSITMPVSGVAGFSGTAPVTGSVAIAGHAPCPEFLLASSSIPNLRILPEENEKEDTTKFKGIIDEPFSTEFLDSDEINSNDPIPKKVILGAIIADSIIAEKGAEIDAKLAELDAFIESELGTIGPIIQTALANADTSKIDSSVDSALLEMESQISSELSMLDEFLESELILTEELVESVVRNLEEEPVGNPGNVQTVNTETVSTEKDALIELELAKLESFVESTLEKSESLVESELEKVNALVESELAKIESVVDSELAMVDSFIKKELEKTDTVVKSELSKMESFVETELASVQKSVEERSVSVTASSDQILSICNPDGKDILQTNVDQVQTIVFEGTFPVSGRTVIIGSTGCPPLLPTSEPLPLYVESFPVFDVQEDESYEPELMSEDITYDDGCVIELPVTGKVVFSGAAPAVGTCKILAACSSDALLPSVTSKMSPPTVGDANPIIPLNRASGSYSRQYFTITINNDTETGPVLYHKKHLPIVRILECLRAGQKPSGAVIMKGDAEFSGNAEAGGGTSISAQFLCPPLTATEEGPDGKKYIWISKKSTNKHTPSQQELFPKPKLEFPLYTEEFPETVIMDADKNYQKHISKNLDVDFGLLGPLAPTPAIF